MGWRPSREVRGYAAVALLFFLVLEGLLAAAILWWPAFEANIAALKPIFGPIPQLAEQMGLIERVGVSAYVVGQHFFKGCSTLGSAAAVLIGMNAIAGEAQRGTLELWLARPITRRRLYTERYFLGLAVLWLPVLLTTATSNLLLARVDDHMNLGSLMVCAVHQSLFLGAIYSVTFMLSALGSQPMRIAFGMIFLCMAEFAVYMVKTATDFSMYRLVDIQTYVTMLRYGLELWPTVGLLLFNLVPFAIGMAAFQRRVP